MKTMGKSNRQKKKMSIRKKIFGTEIRPRLCVFRSAKHLYAQIISDDQHTTMVSVSTTEGTLQTSLKSLEKKEQAKRLGQEIARRCLEKGIQQVVFDRNGFLYHGRVSALADGAREGGLQF